MLAASVDEFYDSFCLSLCIDSGDFRSVFLYYPGRFLHCLGHRFVSLFVVIVAVTSEAYTHLSTIARTLHTLSGNILENLLERQNGEQTVAMERRKTSLGNGTSTAAAH